jgi:sec-independent protein translocase protein TatC
MWLLFEAGVIAAKLFARRGRGERTGDVEPQPAVAATAAAGAAAPETRDPFAADGGADPSPVNESGELDTDRFVPLTEAELEAELDIIEAEEDEDEYTEYDDAGDEDDGPAAEHPSAVEGKLKQVQQLRDAGELQAARTLLYEVLAEGDADQINVARNILQQLDEE